MNSNSHQRRARKLEAAIREALTYHQTTHIHAVLERALSTVPEHGCTDPDCDLCALKAASRSAQERHSGEDVGRHVQGRRSSYFGVSAGTGRGETVTFSEFDAAMHAEIPAGWSHDVLQSNPPLPLFWSARLWHDDGRVIRVQSDIGPHVALALAITNVRLEAAEAVLALRDTQKCATCVHLTPFELAPELNTCPVVNFRIHTESAAIFGCNQWEAK